MTRTQQDMTPVILLAQLKTLADTGTTVYVEDARCKNLVKARLLSVKLMPRKGIYRITWKVALWYRSWEPRADREDMPTGFYVKA